MFLQFQNSFTVIVKHRKQLWHNEQHFHQSNFSPHQDPLHQLHKWLKNSDKWKSTPFHAAANSCAFKGLKSFGKNTRGLNTPHSQLINSIWLLLFISFPTGPELRHCPLLVEATLSFQKQEVEHGFSSLQSAGPAEWDGDRSDWGFYRSD